MVLPEANAAYADQGYWEQRYADESGQTFDWFKSYADVQAVLDAAIGGKDRRLLNLGCGNSALAADLARAGYTAVHNIDYADSVIRDMQARHSDLPALTWETKDIFAITADAAYRERFDVALDKGTIDALVAAASKEDPWNPPQATVDRMYDYMAQIRYLLKIGGRFVHITFAQPHFRRRFCEAPGFGPVTVTELGEGWTYYLYTAERIA
ncbi:hypothetical protein CXG81DRAFT_27704 [Caulochytrium protostelioides]|uniref:Methyltransferase domain-containing protein n=1 Tax=Caulochytrium protostelioides TaxID=1555241 RepID=A0A4P9X3E1_9FUNG|nr:hypothetical protein CXG81DRAFT_27704 [Caulochytrium protostelioides]|eukprot:RKO99545.1 hypothetical protein CXG81DRAFT_27704 [Caulochytrium protostelioides]